MKKHLKPVLTTVMVLAIGFSVSACGQNNTVKQQSMRAKNDLHRIETKTVPYGTNMTDRRINNLDNRAYGVDPLLNNNNNYPYSANRTYGVDGDGMNGIDGSIHKYGVDHNKSASQLANRAKSVSGVKKATVVIHNKDAIVGLDVDNIGKKAIIEKQVHAALKGQYPEYNFHVTSDQGMHKKIQTMNTSMTNGHPLKTLANDVTTIIRDIGNAITAPLR
ncbi:YhcN/YlaJ family sporulation lipoprotein [Bacillus sp. FJAT-28004]|uniref:YhcN/YlaJ family sporulation lipoprotein n=1 Tax=Bacillus sp. FJAT-28004 TaxID=1679165 RepID=UPI0006B58189|nr:YhcN/YlaJ family sporulation lipoprotein [Bacillus sp. FJAT-28004]